MSKSNYVLLFILEIHLSIFFARQFLLLERKKDEINKIECVEWALVTSYVGIVLKVKQTFTS